jgi:Na+:H+ antiporter, NhaA family
MQFTEAFKQTYFNPLKELIHDSRSIGFLLFACTLLSLFIANTNIGASYVQFWNYSLFQIGHESFSFKFFINEGLMTFFFLLAGMEIRREIIKGELRQIKNAILPLGGALGGMLFPALIFMLWNLHSPFQKGWGIPTATDIAFTLAAASMLKGKVSTPAKIFIMALAIMDDIGAIVLIAFVYGGHISMLYLLFTCIVIGLIALLYYFRVMSPIPRLILLCVLWYCLLITGIHPSIAGVIFAFLIPFQKLRTQENYIHHPVYFIALPLFALANTCLPIQTNVLTIFHSSLGWGIVTGLVVGKPLGILSACWVMQKMNWANLPNNTSWSMLLGVTMLAGIGFTMSIFMSVMSFTDEATQNLAKFSVLIASAIALLLGMLWLYFTQSKVKMLEEVE